MAIFTERTAILVDGGFYRIRARNLFGDKSPEERAGELFAYCLRHLDKGKTPDDSPKSPRNPPSIHKLRLRCHGGIAG